MTTTLENVRIKSGRALKAQKHHFVDLNLCASNANKRVPEQPLTDRCSNITASRTHVISNKQPFPNYNTPAKQNSIYGGALSCFSY